MYNNFSTKQLSCFPYVEYTSSLTNMTRKVIYVWSSFLFLLTADAQIFTGSPDSKGTKCMDDDEYNLPWIYSVSPNNAATVEWKKDGTTMLTWIVSINDYTYDTSNGYSSTKLVHNNNGNITIKTLTSSDAGVYVCKVTYASSGAILTSPGVTLEISSCQVSQMSTSLATERTTSVNSEIEMSNLVISIVTGIMIPMNGISASSSGYLNAGSTNFYADTESTATYAYTERKNLNSNIETTYLYVNTEPTQFDGNTITTNEIRTETSGITSIAVSTYQSVFVSTVVNYISRSLFTANQIMTETLVVPSYSIPSYDDTRLPSTFETSNVFPQTFAESSISLPFDTLLSNNFFYTLRVSSDSQITTDTSKTYILSMAISPSYDGGSDIASLNDMFSVPIHTSDTTDSTIEMSNVSRVNNFSLKTDTILISLANATVDSNTVLYSTKPENELLSISGNNSLFQQTITLTDSPLTSSSSVNNQISYSSKMNSHTVKATTGIYSNEIVTSVKSHMHISVRPSQTQLDNQDSTTDFQSTFLEHDSQSTDEVYSSESPEYLLSTLQPTSLLSLHTETSDTGFGLYIETTNMMTFETKPGILTLDEYLYTNPSSMQITAVLPDFKTTLITATINYNSKIIPSMIKPSSKQTYSGISNNEIESSFKDSSFSLDSPSGSLTFNDQYVTNFSSRVVESISIFSTNTIQSGLSEKNKTIIFITITSAVITMIVVMLLIIFARVYMSKNKMKPRREEDNLSWSNKSITQNTAFPSYSFTGKNIYPLLNTSSVSFKMFHYEQHWNGIE